MLKSTATPTRTVARESAIGEVALRSPIANHPIAKSPIANQSARRSVAPSKRSSFTVGGVGGPDGRQLEPNDQLVAQCRGASDRRLLRIQPGDADRHHR